MDYILLSEMKKLYEILRREEAPLSSEEKKASHMCFVTHCEQLVRYATVVRREGLLCLDEIADEKAMDSDGTFDRELCQMIVDAYDPEYVKRIILLKYFSTDLYSFCYR